MGHNLKALSLLLLVTVSLVLLAGYNPGFFANVTLGTDFSQSAQTRIPLGFDITAIAATTTTQWDEQKTVKAITIENIVTSVGAFTCAVNPVLTLLDCGTTVNSCGSPTATLMTTPTLTAIGAENETVSVANVAAGHYIAVKFSAGTCTVFNARVTAMSRTQ